MPDTPLDNKSGKISNSPEVPKVDGNSENEKDMIITYMTLRKTIGILGIALPFILALGELLIAKNGVQRSVSFYFHKDIGTVFVGTLFVVGFFLFAYRGPDKIDNIVANWACIFALGIALFPTTPSDIPKPGEEVIGVIHFIFALLFFLTITCMSLFLFTRSTKPKQSDEKKQRNKVYKSCGYIMLVSIILIGVFHLLPKAVEESLKKFHPVFWLESIALVSFGVSWLTKGEGILKDKPISDIADVST